MPSVDRDESRESRDRKLVLKHQPSISDSGRASQSLCIRIVIHLLHLQADPVLAYVGWVV